MGGTSPQECKGRSMSDVMVAERTELTAEVHPVVAAANALQVINAVTFEQAMELGKACSARIKMVEERLGPAKRKTYEAYREVMELMKSFVDPLEAAKKTVSSRAYSWQQVEEARKRKEAEEARKKAEAEAAEKRRIEEENRLALAERLEKEGMAEQAEEVLSAPVVVEVAEVAAPAPKMTVAGASTRSNWQGKVVDENLIPREYMMPNLVKLNQVTKAMKAETKIPGWEISDVGTVAFRS